MLEMRHISDGEAAIGGAISRILRDWEDEAVEILHTVLHMFDSEMAVIHRSYLEGHPDPDVQAYLKGLDRLKAELAKARNEPTPLSVVKRGGK